MCPLDLLAALNQDFEMPVWWKHYILLIFLLIHGFTHAETPDRLQADLEKLLKTPSTNSDLILKQIAKLVKSHQKILSTS